METINLLSKLKNNCIFDDTSLKTPDKFQTLKRFISNIKEEQLFDIDCPWEPFGSDSVGGLAYYGSKENIIQLEQNILTYLANLSNSDIETQHYAIWYVKNNALLILYEDYDNDYPTQEDVLFIKFGSWTDDVLLPKVLNTYLYLEDAEVNKTWKVGNQIYSKTNSNHEELRQHMQQSLLTIWANY